MTATTNTFTKLCLCMCSVPSRPFPSAGSPFVPTIYSGTPPNKGHFYLPNHDMFYGPNSVSIREFLLSYHTEVHEFFQYYIILITISLVVSNSPRIRTGVSSLVCGVWAQTKWCRPILGYTFHAIVHSQNPETLEIEVLQHRHLTMEQ